MFIAQNAIYNGFTCLKTVPANCKKENLVGAFWFWQKWLLLVAALVAAFGLALALGSRSGVFQFFMSRIDPVFWGLNGPGAAGQAFQGWVYGAWGATVAGWGLIMVFLAHIPFKRQEPWARNCLAVSLGLWYLFDTFYSLYYWVWINVGLNTVLLAALGLPLFFTWRAFGQKSEPSS